MENNDIFVEFCKTLTDDGLSSDAAFIQAMIAMNDMEEDDNEY